jgi:hypothetical protein
MASKYPKREIALVDEEGQEWARATLSAPAIKRLIKLYQLQEIYLQEKEIA